MPRLFTGLSLPERVREQLSRLRQPLPGAKWIENANLHLTLRFIGDVDNRTADELAHALSEISHIGVFNMRLSGLGTFGGREPRQIWADVDAGPELQSLARAHERAARIVGLPPEKRTFRPHVTIARLRTQRMDAIARYLSANAGFRSEPFVVSHVSLFSAKPVTGGGPYVEEEAFALAGVYEGSGEAYGVDVE